MKVFRKDLESRYEIVSTQAKSERFEMIIDGLKNRNDLLKLAGIKKVQVRSIRRGRPGLEEAFLETIGDN